MAIYPDKKSGVLTGRFRVELQRGKERYRQRHDTFAAAQADEARVRAAWGQGEAPPPPVPAPTASEPPSGTTIAKGIALAKGQLWQGSTNEASAWAHIAYAARVFGSNIMLDEIDTLLVDKLIQDLMKDDKTDATVNRYLSHLRTFLVWCKQRKLRSEPLEEGMFSWRKESPGRIRWITTDEEAAIYAYLESRKRDEATAVRDLIEIAIETGCRRDELLTAELEQINGTRLHLWETKTDTPRTVPMTQRIADKLVALIETKRMPTRRGLRSWWQRVREHLGLLEDAAFVFHACRHTRATRMVDAGINVFVIKEWMGHKRIETTLRYAHVKPQNLEDALVRVGEYLASGGQKPQNTAANDVPQGLPHSGGSGQIPLAA